jgi:zinc transporter ZupT
MDSEVLRVFLFALMTAVATGLGAVPFVFARRYPDRIEAIGNAIAAGLMLAASFRLVSEGLNDGAWRTAGGVLAGLGVILVSQRLIARHEDRFSIEKLHGANAMKALLILGVMTVHSAAEGIGVGVSFGGGQEFGIFIATAIAIHNIPEGLAISLVLAPRGVSVPKCAWWSVFSSLPQPLLAVPAFLFVEAFRPVLPFGLGFAAGAMVWMVFEELVPDALEKHDKPAVLATAATIAVAAMVLLQALLDPQAAERETNGAEPNEAPSAETREEPEQPAP